MEGKMKVKYFIDFDETLFDRGRFVPDLFGLVASLGFTEDEIKVSYKMVYKDGYEGIWAQLDYLHTHVRSFNKQYANNLVENFLPRAKQYLYPNTIEFLERINRDIYDPQLLTVGGIEFQKKKVINSGIEKYFSKCNYTTAEKSIALSDLVKKEETFVLLDDKDRELENVKIAFKNSITLKAQRNLLQNLEPLRLCNNKNQIS